MTPSETRSVLTVALLAAFVDGDKHAREREEIRRIAEGLGQGADVHLATLVQDVLLGRTSLDAALPGLATPAAKQLAHEMAVCVCDADGAQSPAERTFLEDLRGRLGLGAEAAAFSERAESLAAAPLATTAVAVPAAAAAAAPSVDAAALDKTILDAAILNGALELLPETLSTLAIVPLQMRLVYRIGQAHGFELDQGHVKDFLATAGVGLTSQVLENAGRKLLGGVLGGMLGGLGKQAVSSGMSFASTYALGHVAKRYYAGGRQLTRPMLKEAFDGVVGEAKAIQGRYLPDMRARAATLDAGKVLALVRGR